MMPLFSIKRVFLCCSFVRGFEAREGVMFFYRWQCARRGSWLPRNATLDQVIRRTVETHIGNRFRAERIAQRPGYGHWRLRHCQILASALGVGQLHPLLLRRALYRQHLRMPIGSWLTEWAQLSL